MKIKELSQMECSENESEQKLINMKNSLKLKRCKVSLKEKLHT